MVRTLISSTDINVIYSSQEYSGAGVAGLGVFLTIVIFAIPIIVVALIAWCLSRMLRNRSSGGSKWLESWLSWWSDTRFAVIRVIPPTTTMIHVPQQMTQPQMHFAFSSTSQQQPQRNYQQGYNVQLPHESSNQQTMQGQQFHQHQFQPKPWTTGVHPPPSQQPWSQDPSHNHPGPSSNFDPFGSQSAVNQGYQPDAPPAYTYDERKEVPRY